MIRGKESSSKEYRMTMGDKRDYTQNIVKRKKKNCHKGLANHKRKGTQNYS